VKKDIVFAGKFASRSTMHSSLDNKIMLGWREWLCLPELKIPAIKAKIDTGARTSALHAFKLRTYKVDGIDIVEFAIHPLQKRTDIVLTCTAAIADYRRVSDSGGHREMRYVIKTPVLIGNVIQEVEITLTDRETMQFRMLLGRTAMTDSIIVQPSASYLTGRTLRHAYGPKKSKKGKK
jgi:hypothetical protein